ncbi:MAG: hypothetical protein J6Y35_00510 [Bacteroidales bacterium]|nr:hypothetical protein [Bacteroidales bacterium]
MKKLFLVALAAGMFVACGNKTNEEAATDSVAVEEPVEVVEAPAPVEEAPVVAEEKTEPAVKVEATDEGAKVKVGNKAEISVQPKQTKGDNI